MKYTYGGATEQVYPQYLDTAQRRTLHVWPGETYDIAPAEGQVVPTGQIDKDGNAVMLPVEPPMPPDDRWTTPRAAKQSKETG